jgi:hypothetical protein
MGPIAPVGQGRGRMAPEPLGRKGLRVEESTNHDVNVSGGKRERLPA